MNKDLRCFNIDLINTMTGYEKHQALKKYHMWLKEVRKEERRLLKNTSSKIYKFKSKQVYRSKSTYLFNIHNYIIRYNTYFTLKGTLTESITIA